MMKDNDLIGIPFVDGGRNNSGLDCWGLAMEMYKRQGIALPDYPVSAMAVDSIANELAANEASWIKLDRPEIGCLVVLRFACGNWANHVGVYIGDGKFIHAYIKTGVCIDRLSHWRSRIAGFYKPGWIK